MARMRRKSVRRAMKVARGVGKSITMMGTVHSVATNPAKLVLMRTGKELHGWGSRPQRRGSIRNRAQTYNRRARRWVKFDTRKRRIMDSSKKKYRNIRAI